MLFKTHILLGLGLFRSLPSVMAISPAMGRPQKPITNPTPQYPPDVVPAPQNPPASQNPPAAEAPPAAPIAPSPQPPSDAPNPSLPLVPTADSIYSKQASCGADNEKVYITSEGDLGS